MTKGGITRQRERKAVDENAIAVKAEEATRPHGQIPGKPLDPDFENPRKGAVGHLCLDPAHNYQPKWFSIVIQKTDDSVPSRQFFGTNGIVKHVKTGVWADVPLEVMEHLQSCSIDVIEQDYDQADVLSGRPVTHVISSTPRFQYTAIASA